MISVAYLALVPADRVNPMAGSDAADVTWRYVDELPDLAFDHAQIIQGRLRHCGEKLRVSPSSST